MCWIPCQQFIPCRCFGPNHPYKLTLPNDGRYKAPRHCAILVLRAAAAIPGDAQPKHNHLTAKACRSCEHDTETLRSAIAKCSKEELSAVISTCKQTFKRLPVKERHSARLLDRSLLHGTFDQSFRNSACAACGGESLNVARYCGQSEPFCWQSWPQRSAHLPFVGKEIINPCIVC